jgi:hypothetical protein
MPLGWQPLLYYLNMISGGYQSPTLLFTFSFIFISFNNINSVTSWYFNSKRN